MSCGVGHRHGLDPVLLWLWHRPVATALIRPLAWESPYAVGAAQEMSKKTKKKKKNIIGDKELHYIMIKGSIQEDITIANIYAPNIGSPQYIKQLLTALKGEINNNTIIVEDFNTPLTAMDRSSRQKSTRKHRS